VAFIGGTGDVATGSSGGVRLEGATRLNGVGEQLGPTSRQQATDNGPVVVRVSGACVGGTPDGALTGRPGHCAKF
jgi:hypothetical protein